MFWSSDRGTGSSGPSAFFFFGFFIFIFPSPLFSSFPAAPVWKPSRFPFREVRQIIPSLRLFFIVSTCKISS
jgi:hypothetical protein